MGCNPDLAVGADELVDFDEQLTLNIRVNMQLRLIDHEHRVIVDVSAKVQIHQDIDDFLLAR